MKSIIRETDKCQCKSKGSYQQISIVVLVINNPSKSMSFLLLFFGRYVFLSDVVRNQGDRFSHDAAQIRKMKGLV